ncbi:MAG: NVEALA domain-containing protein [Tannerella sp.]|jgi:hypothetical protein|nr:NVEALA domain-containing protein [Tannerella sp.]
MKHQSKIKWGMVFFVVTTVSFLNLVKKETKNLDEIVYENVEALASDEGGWYMCAGTGSVNCYGYYVEIKVGLYR